ncbi:MAG: hypothetical protein ABI999_18810 [Acidobacteriota bacterium]
MKVAVLLILLASSSAALFGQTSGPPTTGATPAPQPTPNFPRGSRGSATPTIPTLGNAVPDRDGTAPDGLALQQLIVHTYAEPLYRKATERELLDIAPPQGIANHYAEFLRRPATGIFRLAPDSGCSENSKVINANDECLKYTMPGAGNSYSFRVGTYRLKDLSDLNYSNNILGVSGLMMNGIMVDLGDVPVEDINLQTPGVDLIVKFQPAGDFEAARLLNDQYVTGIERGGLLYRRFLPAKQNATYVLRAVAYHGKLMRSVRGVPYNEFDFDKRRDVIVVFRVAYRDTDGSLIIVWKQLSSTDSPKLKMSATEK